MSNRIFKKIQESIELSTFVSNTAEILGQFDSRKDTHPTKLEQGPPMPPKLRFTYFCDSELPDLCTFYNMAISLNQRGKNQKGRL